MLETRADSSIRVCRCVGGNRHDCSRDVFTRRYGSPRAAARVHLGGPPSPCVPRRCSSPSQLPRSPVFAPFYIALLTPMTLADRAADWPDARHRVWPESRTGVASHEAGRAVLGGACDRRVIQLDGVGEAGRQSSRFGSRCSTRSAGEALSSRGSHEMSIPELRREVNMAPRGDADANAATGQLDLPSHVCAAARSARARHARSDAGRARHAESDGDGDVRRLLSSC